MDGEKWTALGPAYNQAALEKAQQCANASQAVVALYTTSNGVHIAVILPGTLKYSGSWGFNVPNSASFFSHEPEKSYVNKGLSYGFSKSMIKDITLYCSW